AFQPRLTSPRTWTRGNCLLKSSPDLIQTRLEFFTSAARPTLSSCLLMAGSSSVGPARMIAPSPTSSTRLALCSQAFNVPLLRHQEGGDEPVDRDVWRHVPAK